MLYTILDCYTDEPAGLGVPPFLGTYPRYLAGAILDKGDKFLYLTIDDLRLFRKYSSKIPKKQDVTNKRIHNLTSNYPNVKRILEETDVLVVAAGMHTPGKYLAAEPASLREITSLVKDLKCKKVLTGPAVIGTQQEGGKFAEKTSKEMFDYADDNFLGINEYSKVKRYAVKGAALISQIPRAVMAEIETGKGCPRQPGCSFCLEPIKNRLEFREQKDIHKEIGALHSQGIRHFRLGKQSCFYSYKNNNPDEIKKLLEPIRQLEIKTLHIDNVNPLLVLGEKGRKITELIVEHCTAGNIAAFGVESFDKKVIEDNNLNTTPEQAFEAVKIINEAGGERGENGMQKFLPGINIILGLKSETKQTLEENYSWLKKMLDAGLLIRRINIRQVAVFPGTPIYSDVGNKYLKKNRRHYWSFREKIRKSIDHEMLKNLVPNGTILKEALAEMHQGKTTFLRQISSYPLIIGVNQRLELGKFYNLEVTGHMLRSVTAKVR